MTDELTAARFLTRLHALASTEELAKQERYFPLATRGDDVFLGVRMGHVFALAKEFVAMPLEEVETLLDSPLHEARVGAVSIMDAQARRARTPPERRRELFELYLRRHDRINAWDLVDRAAIHVVGYYLRDKPRDVLVELARSEDPWRRRTAVVATMALPATGEDIDTFTIAEVLIDDPTENVQKATGWALRTADGPRLLDFLDRHAPTMPRITLRNAIEKLDPEQRRHYLGLRRASGALTRRRCEGRG